MKYHTTKISALLALLIVFGLVGSCNDGTFSGSNGAVRNSSDQNKKNPNKTGRTDAPDSGDDNDDNDDKDGKDDKDDIDDKDDKNKNDDDLGDEEDDADKDKDKDGDITTDDETLHLPQKCTATNGKVVSGVTECPLNNAAFTSDDGSSARVGCCPLPSKDILDKASKTINRAGSCQAEEIAVGSDGNGFMCRKINTKKYKLEAAQQVCYRGNGASGGSGSSNCSNIIAQLQGLIGLENDKDGCVAQPYGAIMTHKTGKDCKDQKASVIVEKATGKPVQMFPP